MLINFEKNPDNLYVGFEPQVFNDDVTGTGFIVIAYRVDETLDIYHQPGLDLSHKNFDFVLKGLNQLIERPLEGAHLDLTPDGIDVAFAFDDIQGRPIEVRIKEHSRKKRKPFTLLAPVGSSSEKPQFLPLIILYDFYFVRRKGTEFTVKIDGTDHQPDTLPAPIDLSPVYFVRYATDPFIIMWNANYTGPLTAYHPDNQPEIQIGDAVYDLVKTDGHYEIKRMRFANDRHTIQFAFTPPVPDVMALRDGANLNGTLTIRSDAEFGEISGSYSVQRQGETVEMQIHPDGGWQPRIRKPSVQLMFTLVSMFKGWPKSYNWTARIDISGNPHIQSQWQRV